MTFGFKITSWEGHQALQIRNALGSLYLDAEDIQKLKAHLMKDEIMELERLSQLCDIRTGFECQKVGYDRALSLFRGEKP